MEVTSAGDLLRDARVRHGLSQKALATRAGRTSSSISEIESGRSSPTVAALRELLQLLGEELFLSAESRETGIDLTLNQENLELSPEDRVLKGLAFADLVRLNRGGGSEGLGQSLQPGPLVGALDRHEVDFVVIGSIAGLAHGSAYPTYDLDVAYAAASENRDRLAVALGEIGIQINGEALGEQALHSFETEFGTLDVLWEIPGVAAYEELRRDATAEQLAGVEVQVASLDHLIAMKRAANRAKDRIMVMEYVELADEIRKGESS